MKKLLFVLAFIIISLCANAQWNVRHQSADELKETPERDVITYSDSNGNMIMWWSDNDELGLYMVDGIFNYYTFSYTRRTDVTVGLYKDGQLIYKNKIMFFSEEGGKRAYVNGSYSRKWKEFVNMIKNHLMNEGPARFIADRYGMGEMDLTVPMFDISEEE